MLYNVLVCRCQLESEAPQLLLIDFCQQTPVMRNNKQQY